MDNIRAVLLQKEPYHHAYLSPTWYSTLIKRRRRALRSRTSVEKDSPLYVVISCDTELDPPCVGAPNKLSKGLKRGLPILLDLLRKFDAMGTFFVTALAAQAFPGTIDLIKEGGHEIASHGFSHRESYDLRYYSKNTRQLSKQELYTKIYTSKKILESVSGRNIRSFRAPFTRISGYTLEALSRIGFHSDASLPNGVFGKVFPYYPSRKRYWTEGDLPIFEIPQSVSPVPSFKQFLFHEPYRVLQDLYVNNIETAKNASNLIVDIAKELDLPAVIHIPSHSWEFVKIDPKRTRILTGKLRRTRLEEFMLHLKSIGAQFVSIETIGHLWTSMDN